MKSKSTRKLEINKETNLAELMFTHPEAEEVLVDFGLHCAFCAANSFDTIEAGSKIHGMQDDEIEEMIERIKEVVEHGE